MENVAAYLELFMHRPQMQKTRPELAVDRVAGGIVLDGLVIYNVMLALCGFVARALSPDRWR